MDYFATTKNYKYGNYEATWKTAEIMLLKVTRIHMYIYTMIQLF